MEFLDQFKEKYEQLMEEDVECAIKYCTDMLEKSNNADIFVCLGEALIVMEDFESAINYLSEGLNRNCSDKLLALNLKGEALFYVGKFNESRQYFNEVLKTEDNIFFANVYIIDIDIAEGKYTNSINRINTILNSNYLNIEESAFMETKKGWIMFQYLEMQEEAFRMFENSLNKDINCSTAYVGLGCYYLYKNNYDAAISNYENALNLGECYDVVYTGLAEAKLKRSSLRNN